jgi:hypothetical protein
MLLGLLRLPARQRKYFISRRGVNNPLTIQVFDCDAEAGSDAGDSSPSIPGIIIFGD